jgi:hypothetical protein
LMKKVIEQGSVVHVPAIVLATPHSHPDTR